jgi:glycosyltransferase involved in cell wall biosynthesis
MFPPGDADALGQAIASLITNPERARQMGEKGYDRLVSTFHIARNIESTVRLYDRLLDAR